jgi:predicted DsbA family dithiol-disulfide isomerase
MTRVTVTFDYLCPFARIANEVVLRALRAGAPHEVDFRAFSLSQAHTEEGDEPVWRAERPPSGVLALEWGLALRDQLPERFPAAHLAIFEARHDHGRDLNDPEVLRQAVASVGIDPDEVEKLVGDGTPAAALAADHTWAVEQHRAFGVPTFIAGDRAVFVRLMSRPADDRQARDTLDRLLAMVTDWPDLNEFKATRIPR